MAHPARFYTWLPCFKFRMPDNAIWWISLDLTEEMCYTGKDDTVEYAPPQMEPGAWVGNPRTVKESHRLAGCYEAVARRLGIAFADAVAPGVGLAFDGVHFSETGHQAFARGMRAALAGTG